jgi:hypothetical protein
MATEEWIKRAIQNGKLYEDLPPRVRTVLPVSEWKVKCVRMRPPAACAKSAAALAQLHAPGRN